MAAAPVKFIERRRWITGGSDELFPASRQHYRRKRLPRVDRDSRENLSATGWRELLSAARLLCSRFGPIGNAVNSMATYAIGTGFEIQYRGANSAWGDAMEAAIHEHDKVCDFRGNNWDFRTALIQDVISIIRDGDANFILTDNGAGYPLYQSIPAHRVGNGKYTGKDTVEGGEYDGHQISNGVILDAYLRPIAYRVCGSSADIEDSFTDVPAKDFGQYFRPVFQDQVRGITWLASAIQEVADLVETRSHIRTGIKAESLITLIEENESGRPTDANAISGGAAEDESGTPIVETLEETIRYFKAGSGSKISAPNTNRPSLNSQEFMFEILRGAFESLGWPIELYDPTKLGGANIRLRVAQAARTIQQLQSIACKIATHKHRFTVAKLIKAGALPFDVDWWKFEHQLPRDLTVDNGRDTKADLEKFNAGADTLAGMTGRDGEDWQEVIDQRVKEEAYLKKQAEAAGVDPARIRFLNNAPQKPEEKPANENQ